MQYDFKIRIKKINQKKNLVISKYSGFRFWFRLLYSSLYRLQQNYIMEKHIQERQNTRETYMVEGPPSCSYWKMQPLY